MNSEKSKIKRAPKRGVYDNNKIYEILDNHCLCHVSFIQNDQPFSIPTLYGREGNILFIHGASISRLITQLEKGIDVCISVAGINGLVIARSAFHHSVNYESIVIFGKGELVSANEKTKALKIISEHIIDGRWEECRPPNENELKATKVIKVVIEESSAKVRTGDPVDEKEDYSLQYWAGVIPLKHNALNPIPDKRLNNKIPVPKSVNAYIDSVNKDKHKK
jgi:nitroimidazol reductase NimA-like FMN-containing flavoprotein (pyridoxamine 5'-phosphate oxidase superfamily)